MTELVNLLDVITKDRALPPGCDTWAIRSVHTDLTSSRDYRYPFPGKWAKAAGPFDSDNDLGCPSFTGDGICAATNWRGMASGGIPATTLLLVAYNKAKDFLGQESNGEKVRLRRMRIVELIDGAKLLRLSGKSANLTRADLTRANLTRADLTRADLTRADLTRANLTRADLTRANLTRANLTRANLTGANLYGADLYGANLTGADLYGANLTGADLAGANLYGADLYGANLTHVNREALKAAGWDVTPSGLVVKA